MKKKYIIRISALVLAVAMTASMAGCSLWSDKKKDGSTANQEESQTAGGATGSGQSIKSPASKYSGLSYYNESKLSAYEAFAAKHADYAPEKIVTFVNIGLDRPFYTEIGTITNPEDILVLCNKYNALPEDYVPSDLVSITASNTAASGLKLRKEAAEAFDRLCAAAKTEGYSIYAASAYRSYSYQNSLYNNYVLSDGVEKADTYSARPGHSEHQTGLAVDVKNATTVYDSFGTTKEYLWAKDNIYKYGFIIRYLPSTIDITGYKSEEWHFRYVGVETATQVYRSGLTYDEYYVRNLIKK